MRSFANDLDCLQALAEGQDCWPQFWDLFGGFILFELRRIGVAKDQDRDDLYQELATKLIAHDYQVIRTFLAENTGLPFIALLRTVIRSIVIDDWRRKKRWREVQLLPDWEVGQAPGAAPDANPAAVMHQSTRLTCIIEGLARELSDTYAFQVLHLRYVEEKPVNDIAKQLGLSPNAVSQRLRVYRRRLLEGYGQQLAEMLND